MLEAHREPARERPGAHQVRFRGAPVTLRPNEFRLLAHFLAHPDQVFSRQALIAQIGKDSEAIDERTVDVWIGRPRRPLPRRSIDPRAESPARS